MPAESIKIAVRVRPFSQRELEKESKCVVKMKNNVTSLLNPAASDENHKSFTFDHSYWSHDGYQENETGVLEPVPGSNYVSQKKIYEELGKEILSNAFAGYNCSVFAYGQTSSGKSYSMVGYGANQGLIPLTCKGLLAHTEREQNNLKRYEVSFSMLEIYNEQVRCLLSAETTRGGLPVRQTPADGSFYVQGLKRVPVGSYADFKKLMDQGTAKRTVASTNMNVTSSRAHTVMSVEFHQFVREENGNSGVGSAGGETRKNSILNLIDLAGSERANATGATGDRLKEGVNINKSLHTLGNVISALADISAGKKKVIVPYRESVLTKLLQNALGGNSKTIMLAAISPSHRHYDETLSTLRYADRAKRIKTTALVNENQIDKLIRELKAENERLKNILSSSTSAPPQNVAMPAEDMAEMRKRMECEIREQISENMEALAATDKQYWQNKLEIARQETSGQYNSKESEGGVFGTPYLSNLNEDPMLSGVLLHSIGPGCTTVGSSSVSRDHEENAGKSIRLLGVSILEEHAILEHDVEIGCVILKLADKKATVKINGESISSEQELENQDRILFGSNHLYIYHDPAAAADRLSRDQKTTDSTWITWEFAQKEIAQAKGFVTENSDVLSTEQEQVQEEILELLPLISEASAISEELDKRKRFELNLISHLLYGFGASNVPRVVVKMTDTRNGNAWLWEKDTFTNRYYLMQELYQLYLEGEDEALEIPVEQDPFWEPLEDILVGSATLFLQSLAYGLEFEDTLTVVDHAGQEEGTIDVSVRPCEQDGFDSGKDYYVDTPEILLDLPYSFKVCISQLEMHRLRFAKGLQVKYKLYASDPFSETQKICQTLSPNFAHVKVIQFDKVTTEHLRLFQQGCLTFIVFASQDNAMPVDARQARKGKFARLHEAERDQSGPPRVNRHLLRHRESKGKLVTQDSLADNNECTQLRQELLVTRKKLQKFEERDAKLKELCCQEESRPELERNFDSFLKSVMDLAFSDASHHSLRAKSHALSAALFLHEKVKGHQAQLAITDGESRDHQAIRLNPNTTGKKGARKSRACLLQ